MKWFRSLWRRQLNRREVAAEYFPEAPEELGASLAERLAWFHGKLDRCADVVFREFSSGTGRSGALLFLQGMIDRELFETMLDTGLMAAEADNPEDDLTDHIRLMPSLPVSSMLQTSSLTQAMRFLLDGQLILMLDNVRFMHVFPVKKVDKRAISEAQNEAVIRGPRESFIEDLETNITMIRRRIKHPALKTEKLTFGRYTDTAVMLVYIDELCKPKLVEEVKTRLQRVNIDGVLGSSYLEEYLEDNPFSPFPQVQYTERPDTLSSALLEGRIAVFVDGTPMPLIVPVTLYMLLQSAEDYYQRFIASTWIRWIRYIYLLVSLLFPSTYVAITTFHPEMLPPTLLVTVAAAREMVPFPALVEAFLMEISFEALREAGLRIPKPIGQTVSIIGALVIGQAAVEAGIVSAPMVIIVSLTGIASFIIPHYDLGLTFRLLRFPIMFLAGSFGLFGIIVGIFLIYLHLVNLRSLGTPYLAPTAPLYVSDLKDMAIRAPWWMMRQRPTLFGTRGGRRQATVTRPAVPDEEGD